MSKFRVQRKATVWVETTVEAENEEQALAICETDVEVWGGAEELSETFAYDDSAEFWVSRRIGE